MILNESFRHERVQTILFLGGRNGCVSQIKLSVFNPLEPCSVVTLASASNDAIPTRVQ